MADATWSVQDAKNRFSAMIEAAARAPQTVTKHGRPKVVVIDADEFARLRQLDRHDAPGFGEHLLRLPQDGEDFPRLRGRLRQTD